jgi:hypothetical protein
MSYSTELKALGRYLETYQSQNRQPFFRVSELGSDTGRIDKIPLERSTIDKMISEQQFRMPTIQVYMSRKAATLEIRLCLEDDTHQGSYCISGFPRSLEDDEHGLCKFFGFFLWEIQCCIILIRWQLVESC